MRNQEADMQPLTGPLNRITPEVLRGLFHPEKCETIPEQFFDLSELQGIRLTGSEFNRTIHIIEQLSYDLPNLLLLTIRLKGGVRSFSIPWERLTNLRTILVSVGPSWQATKILKQKPPPKDKRTLVLVNISPTKILSKVHLWGGEYTLEELHVINHKPTYKQYSFASDLSLCTRLAKLHLQSWQDFCNVHSTIGQLTSLETLDIRAREWGDRGLLLDVMETLHIDWLAPPPPPKLPAQMVNLRNLKSLRLTTRLLTKLPEFVARLECLESLNLFGCEALKQIPVEIGNLTSLRNLGLRGCRSLETLPATIGDLGNCLESLDLLKCTGLKRLPMEIGSLTSLRDLNLMVCFRLKCLPHSIGALQTCLESLELSSCVELEQLPVEIGNLSTLRRLKLTGFKSLRTVPSTIGKLTNLRCLILTFNASLDSLPMEISQLSNLRRIEITIPKELPDGVQPREDQSVFSTYLSLLPDRVEVIRATGWDAVNDHLLEQLVATSLPRRLRQLNLDDPFWRPTPTTVWLDVSNSNFLAMVRKYQFLYRIDPFQFSRDEYSELRDLCDRNEFIPFLLDQDEHPTIVSGVWPVLLHRANRNLPVHRCVDILYAAAHGPAFAARHDLCS